MVKKITPPNELIEKWKEEDEKAREIRRREADWKFIEKQPFRIKLALLYFIEYGDIYKAAKIAGLTIDEFNEIRIKANIPRITF